MPRRKKMPTRRPRRPPTTNTPAVKLEADFNPSMSGLLAREAGAAEQADRKQGPDRAVANVTTLRERVGDV